MMYSMTTEKMVPMTVYFTELKKPGMILGSANTAL